MAHEKYMVTRAKYKAIKKYDHQQMEKFCFDIYTDGVAKGSRQDTPKDTRQQSQRLRN